MASILRFGMLGLGLAACSDPDLLGSPPDASVSSAPQAPDLGDAVPDLQLVDAAGDAIDPIDAAAAWATYTIAPGAHEASVGNATPGNPLRFLVFAPGRDYQLELDDSAMYEIIDLAQPDDQLDWNKLPGLSDCGTVDLAQEGLMFGWRWRLDAVPPALEITAYANNGGQHLTTSVLVSLDGAELASRSALRYRLWIEGAEYHFAVEGSVLGRTIAVETSLPRACPDYPASGIKWASGLYFGGTSTAPSTIAARISERSFVP